MIRSLLSLISHFRSRPKSDPLANWRPLQNVRKRPRVGGPYFGLNNSRTAVWCQIFRTEGL